MKVGYAGVVLLLIGVVVISGCVNQGMGSQAILDVAKSSPQIQEFLSEHPNATIKITHWDNESVLANITDIRNLCGNQMKVKEYYKLEMESENISAVSWIDVGNQVVDCAIVKGKEEVSPSPQPPVPPSGGTGGGGTSGGTAPSVPGTGNGTGGVAPNISVNCSTAWIKVEPPIFSLGVGGYASVGVINTGLANDLTITSASLYVNGSVYSATNLPLSDLDVGNSRYVKFENISIRRCPNVKVVVEINCEGVIGTFEGSPTICAPDCDDAKIEAQIYIKPGNETMGSAIALVKNVGYTDLYLKSAVLYNKAGRGFLASEINSNDLNIGETYPIVFNTIPGDFHVSVPECGDFSGVEITTNCPEASGTFRPTPVCVAKMRNAINNTCKRLYGDGYFTYVDHKLYSDGTFWLRIKNGNKTLLSGSSKIFPPTSTAVGIINISCPSCYYSDNHTAQILPGEIVDEYWYARYLFPLYPLTNVLPTDTPYMYSMNLDSDTFQCIGVTEDRGVNECIGAIASEVKSFNATNGTLGIIIRNLKSTINLSDISIGIEYSSTPFSRTYKLKDLGGGDPLGPLSVTGVSIATNDTRCPDTIKVVSATCSDYPQVKNRSAGEIPC